VAVLRRDSLELTALIGRGRVLMDRGEITVGETWIGESDRTFSVDATKDAKEHQRQQRERQKGEEEEAHA
jgi:hypothetical protein